MAAKTILITGSTDGIGRATARALAERGGAVIVHGRDEQRAAEAARELAAATGSRQVTPVAADFGSLAEVRAMAARILRTCPRLDVLINNAGIAVRHRQPAPGTGALASQRGTHRPGVGRTASRRVITRTARRTARWR